MTTDLQLNTSCLTERVKSAPTESTVDSLKSAAIMASARGGRRRSSMRLSIANATRRQSKTSRQSLKFCAKNFVTKWSQDLEKQYTMGELLGEGAYGNVYACTCLQSGAERAVKVIPKSTDNYQNEMVIREFEVLKELDHPNILKNYALFETETHFHIVTDWIRGGELYDLLESEFTEDEVRALMKALLSCMNYCHQSKIVHRDLKPENILIDGDNRDFSTIKVIDFGLAQFFQNDQGSFTEAAGSSYYMSPQVIEGQYSCKCDIWSCGVIAFVCLGGYAPWAGEDEMDTAQQILDADQVYFDDPVWDEFSDEALDFIELLLTCDEKDRPMAAVALQHEWLQPLDASKRLSREGKDKESIEGSARLSLESLKSFSAANSKLKQCTYSLIASQLIRKEEKEEVDRMFSVLDADCDGKIGLKDMQTIYNDRFGVNLSDDDVAAIIYEVNLSGSGAITYSEFVIASLKEKGLVSNENLEMAFQILDKSGSGYLGVQDLCEVLNVPEEMEGYVQRKIIAPADFDNDGKISLKDFKKYFDADGMLDASEINCTSSRRRRSTLSTRGSTCSRRSTIRKSFRASVLLSPENNADIVDEFADSMNSSIASEPNFRSLLNIFEGQIKENNSIPSLFRQACS